MFKSTFYRYLVREVLLLLFCSCHRTITSPKNWYEHVNISQYVYFSLVTALYRNEKTKRKRITDDDMTLQVLYICSVNVEQYSCSLFSLSLLSTHSAWLKCCSSDDIFRAEKREFSDKWYTCVKLIEQFFDYDSMEPRTFTYSMTDD